MLPLAVRLLLQVMIFAGIGELALRLDEETGVFQGGARLENRPKPSAELLAVKAGTYTPPADQFRVMLLGDSYLFGAGVPDGETFAHRLRQSLSARNPGGLATASLLDLTMPGSNTFTNTQAFHQARDLYRPHLAILAYNANDVYGRMEEKPLKAAATPAPAAAAAEADRGLNTVVAIRRVLYQSKLLQFALIKLNMELKLRGIVLPGSEFDHQVNQSHAAGYPGWRKSQDHLRRLAEACRERGIHLIVVNVPELNMLSHRQPFQKMDAEIKRFFTTLADVTYLDGAQPFLARPVGDPKEYAISKHDGHPNAKAHQVLAEFVYQATLERVPRLTSAAAAVPAVR